MQSRLPSERLTLCLQDVHLMVSNLLWVQRTIGLIFPDIVHLSDNPQFFVLYASAENHPHHHSPVSILGPLCCRLRKKTAANALTLQTPPPDRWNTPQRERETERGWERGKKVPFFQQRCMSTHEKACSSARWVSHLSYPVGVGHPFWWVLGLKFKDS